MIYLTRVDPEQNMQRYYCFSVQPDLLGGYCLIREWGRIGRAGQQSIEHFSDDNAAFEVAIRLADTKRRRGYS
jgi:predicted DNA-binding WGR domain protein